MKIFRPALLFILIGTFLLSACSVPGASGGSYTPELSAPEQSAEPSPQATAAPSILNGAIAADEKGVLSSIPSQRIASMTQQRLFLLGGNLLLSGGAWSEGGSQLLLTLISGETGETLQETSFSGIEISDVQLCGEYISVTDWSDGQVMLLNPDFSIAKEYSTGTESCALYVSPDGKSVYCFTQNGIKIYDMANGSLRVLFPGSLHLYASSRCGDNVSIFYTDRESQLTVYAVVDLATGECYENPFSGTVNTLSRSGETWLADVLGGDADWYLGRSGRPSAFDTDSGIMSLLPSPTRLLLESYGSGGMSYTLYAADGSFLSACAAPEGFSPSGDMVWSEQDGGYYFIMTDAQGRDTLFFWDLSVPVTGMDLSLRPAYESSSAGTAVSAGLYEKAAETGSRYGVEILIADRAETSYREFSAAPETDEAAIAAALDSMEKVLSAYPEGFMSQLCYASYGKIEFHLVGALTKTTLSGTESGFTSFSGFMDTADGKTIVVVDINRPGSLEQTLHHEIGHMIDNKLSFDAGIRIGALYSEEGWSALNPSGFAYAESYTELPVDIFSQGLESYFIDVYSRTFAREDRATIFEHAMAGADWAFSGSEERSAKLDYFCRCIREAFNTELWPETTVWEATLERCS